MKIGLTLILSIVIGMLVSCTSQKTAKESIKIEQIDTELPIGLVGDTVNNTIVRCRIPFTFCISNSSLRTKYIYMIDFFNEKYGWATGSYFLSQYIDDELKRMTSQALIDEKINKWKSQTFVIEPICDIDQSAETQMELQIYIKDMKSLKNDKLSVGDMKKFKEKHPLLVETLLKRDSICLVITDDKFKSHIDEAKDIIITLPIRY